VPSSSGEVGLQGLFVCTGSAAVPRSRGEDDARDLLVQFRGGAVLRSGSGGDARSFCDRGLGFLKDAVGFRDLDCFGM
jgi:hypothetical protein